MTYQNILIIKLSAIGDVIHALPVAHALKETFPQCLITWVVEKPARDILINNPDIDEVIIFDKPAFKSWKGLMKHAPAFSKMLRDQKFDLVLDLQGLFKSAAIAALSGAKERLGYCNMREMSHCVSHPVCGSNRDGHVVERYLDVVRYLGCPVSKAVFSLRITEEEKEQAATIALGSDLDITKNNYIVMAPGTNWATKCWPMERYAELTGLLATGGMQSVLIGGPGDRALAEQIKKVAGVPVVDLTGKTSLKQLAYVIQKSNAFIGGDTGPMHLAVAVEVPTIALFGPTDPARNGPYSENSRVLAVKEDCARCWQRVCPKKKNCLANITAHQVYSALQNILECRR